MSSAYAGTDTSHAEAMAAFGIRKVNGREAGTRAGLQAEVSECIGTGK